MTHKYAHLFHVVMTQHISDEKAYLFSACPALDRIVKAAFRGNGEAQWVLADIYGDWSCEGIIPYNKYHKEYWEKKAEASGEPRFPRLNRMHVQDLS